MSRTMPPRAYWMIVTGNPSALIATFLPFAALLATIDARRGAPSFPGIPGGPGLRTDRDARVLGELLDDLCDLDGQGFARDHDLTAGHDPPLVPHVDGLARQSIERQHLTQAQRGS